MSEETIYSDNNVSISTSRITAGGTTYALRNVSSVKMTTTPAKTGCAIALIIVAAGVYVFVPPRGPLRGVRDGRGRGDLPILVCVGAAAGFGSGLSGAGGPLFSVPLMVILGNVL